MKDFFEKASSTVYWNLFLITLGSFVYALGVNGIAFHHQFLLGGIYGLGLLLTYIDSTIPAWAWYLGFNVIVFFLGYKLVSKKFFLYSIYGTACVTFFTAILHVVIPVEDSMLAAIAAGVVSGAGMGITLRSRGSTGGLDIIGIILNQKWNIRIGMSSSAFNFILFSGAMAFLDLDRILFSMVLMFAAMVVMEQILSLSNQRKAVMIISDHIDEIADSIIKKMRGGGTFLNGKGAYTRADKKILLTVVNNYQLKRLEETVFSIDSNAFMIIENTFNVFGWAFSKRKLY